MTDLEALQEAKRVAVAARITAAPPQDAVLRMTVRDVEYLLTRAFKRRESLIEINGLDEWNAESAAIEEITGQAYKDHLYIEGED